MTASKSHRRDCGPAGCIGGGGSTPSNSFEDGLHSLSDTNPIGLLRLSTPIGRQESLGLPRASLPLSFAYPHLVNSLMGSSLSQDDETIGVVVNVQQIVGEIQNV